MTTQRIETRLNEATVQELDGWRNDRTPAPSRSEAVRLLLEERLLQRRDVAAHAADRRGRCPSADRLGAIFALERVSGFGPVKFRAMHEASVDAQAAIGNPDLLPFKGRTGEKLRSGVRALSEADLAEGRTRAIDQLERADKLSAAILLHGDTGYPARVYASNNPVPVLYVRGGSGGLGRRGDGGRRGLAEHARSLRGRCPAVRCSGGAQWNGGRVGVRHGRRLDGTQRGRGGRRPHGVRDALRSRHGVPAGEPQAVGRTARVPGSSVRQRVSGSDSGRRRCCCGSGTN